MEIKTNRISYRNLKNIQISFKEGLINGVIGNNGSGKTSLAKILSGVSYPNTGNIELDGIAVDLNNPTISYDMISFEVGYVAQNSAYQIFGNTVKEYMATVLNKYNYKNDVNHLKDSLKLVSLDEDILKRKIASLSDGELFKVVLASVLSLNPKIIILDEPTVFLDFHSRKKLIKLLRLLKNRYHKTIIILSQNSDFIYKICDYIYILNNNKLICEGTKKEVFNNLKNLEKQSISIPRTLEIEALIASKKHIKMEYRDNINDLLKDIYFYKE